MKIMVIAIMVFILSFAMVVFCLFEYIDKLLQHKLPLGIFFGILLGASACYLCINSSKINITSEIKLSDFITLFLTIALILVTFYYARLTHQIYRGKPSQEVKMIKEEYFSKNGTLILLDYSNSKRWAVILIGKENGVAIFETEREARAYLDSLIKEKK